VTGRTHHLDENMTGASLSAAIPDIGNARRDRHHSG
jgi:hypothetical protein